MGCKAAGRRPEWGRWWGWGPLRKQGCVNKSYSLGKGTPQGGQPLSSLVGVQLSVFQLRCTKWPCRKGCCGKLGLLGHSSCFPILHVRNIVATSDAGSSLKCSPAEGKEGRPGKPPYILLRSVLEWLLWTVSYYLPWSPTISSIKQVLPGTVS